VKVAALMLVGLLGVQSAAAQSEPEDVVRSFFKAEDDGRWRDAARMLDLRGFERIRQNMLNYSLRSSLAPRTAEDLMRLQPDMPRNVAEYQARKTNEAMRAYDPLEREFARVPTADSLRALSPEEAAARWLEAQGPGWKTRLALRESARSPTDGCPDLPDSVRAKIMMESEYPTARVLGSTTGSPRYVIVGMDWKGKAGLDGSSDVAGPGLQVLTLRNVGGSWKIIPTEEMPVSRGLGPTAVFQVSCHLDSARTK